MSLGLRVALETSLLPGAVNRKSLKVHLHGLKVPSSRSFYGG